jgi:HD-GYP domain-containing protein (c-di-GMP phosphodiesterase class II)
MREVPKDLWGEVLEVVTAITWGPDGNEPDPKVSEAGVAQLRAIYARQEGLGQPEPFLTEALADYTDDAAEAVALYRRALAQSTGYPDEPTHTKRICLASRLIELGDLAGARSELTLGRAEAERLNDDYYVAMADELLGKVAV